MLVSRPREARGRSSGTARVPAVEDYRRLGRAQAASETPRTTSELQLRRGPRALWNSSRHLVQQQLCSTSSLTRCGASGHEGAGPEIRLVFHSTCRYLRDGPRSKLENIPAETRPRCGRALARRGGPFEGLFPSRGAGYEMTRTHGTRSNAGGQTRPEGTLKVLHQTPCTLALIGVQSNWERYPQ
jgi:hypothetical protein